MIFGFNAREVFLIAIMIEENGRAFYEEARRRIADADVKKLFEELAKQEVEHKMRFESLMGQLPRGAEAPTIWDPEAEQDLYLKAIADEHVFGPSQDVEAQLERVGDAVDALRLAIQFEKDSVILFLTMKSVTDEQKGQEFIEYLIKEEQEHLRRLTAELRRKRT